MKKEYHYKGGITVKLSDCKNYASINRGNLLPIKHDGKSPYIIKTTLRENGCIKKAEKLRLV